MNITEGIDAHESASEVIFNGNEPGSRQLFNPEPVTEPGQAVQPGIHGAEDEYQSKISFKDVVVSLITVLCFTAILLFVYWIHPS